MATRSNPTLKQIATAAGLSVSGVSLAMRNDPSIPAATCAKIQQIAKRLGYRPDPELAKLMAYLRKRQLTRSTAVLGLLTLHQHRAFWRSNNYLKRLHTGIVNRAKELGYEVDEFWLNDPAMPQRRTCQIIASRGIKAVIIIDGPTRIDALDFDFSKFCTVAIGYGISLPLHRVCQHQYQEMFRLLRQLRALGYRRPGLVLSGETDIRTQHHYSAAFTIAHRDAPTPPPMLIAEDITRPLFEEWFLTNRPDVLIAQNPSASVTAETYLTWLDRNQVRVPQDVGFVSLDVDPAGQPLLSGILQDYERVAAAAVEYVVAQVKHSDRGYPASPNVLLVEGRWIEGTTTRRA